MLLAKNLQRAFKIDSTINKIIFYSIGILIIVTIFIFFVLFKINSMEKKTYADIINNDQKIYIEKITSLKSQFPTVAIQLTNNTDILKIITANEKTPQTIVRAINKLDEIRIYNRIDTVILYNQKTNSVCSNNMKLYSFDDYLAIDNQLEQIIASYNNGLNLLYLPKFDEHSGKFQFELIYIYKDYRNFLVILKQPSETIAKSILNTSKDDVIYMFDNKYNPIFINNAIDDSSKIDEYAEILKNCKDNKGYFIKSGYMYVYNKAQQYSCINVVEMSKIVNLFNSNSLLLWVYIFMFFSVIILLGLLLSKNVRGFLNKYSEKLLNTNNKTKTPDFDMIIEKFFTGMMLFKSDYSIIENEIFSNNTVCFRMLMIRIDAYDFLVGTNSENDTYIIKYGINNIIEEILSNVGVCKTIILNNDCMGAILSCDSFVNTNKIHNHIKEIQEIIQKYFNISLSFTISRAYSSIDAYNSIQSNILKLSEFRYIFGHKSIINEELIAPIKTSEDSYPSDIEENILLALNAENLDLFKTLLNKLKQEIKSRIVENAQIYTIALSISIINQLKKYNFIISGHHNLLSKLFSSDTIDETVDLLIDLTSKVISAEETIENDLFIKQINSLTEENYKNPEYCLGYVADALNLSPTYLGRKFKKVFNKSFNAYLSELRINKACELLENTNDKITDISTSLGFSSQTYFSTTFKKYKKMMPKEYRDAFKGANNN